MKGGPATMKKHSEIEREADLQPQRSLPLFRKQLADLDKLKGRKYNDAHQNEQEWKYFTETLIERTFGNPSSTFSKWRMAGSAGQYYLSPRGMPPIQLQKNFEARLQAFEALLKSVVADLQLDVQDGVKGSYQAGEEYDFYRDLKAIITEATAEVFIVDPYIDDTLFDIYVNRVEPGINVRILTRNPSSAVQTIATKYASGHAAFELRVTNDIHDRVLFVDDRCWVVGQSIKDAADKKPTYIVEVTAAPMRDIYEKLWSAGIRRV